MATYVTYNNFENENITILNFIMVDSLENVNEIFKDFENYRYHNFNDKAYIAIKNAQAEYDPLDPNNPNYQNLLVCTSTMFPTTLEVYSNEGIWKPGTNEETSVFTITGNLQNARLKKIFSALTRFSERDLRITVNNDNYKTLNNTVIFIPKTNIKDLFITEGLTDDIVGIYTDLNDMMEKTLKYKMFYYCNKRNEFFISNYFRTFDKILDIPAFNDVTQDAIKIRMQFDFINKRNIASNKIKYFRDFINGTRNLSSLHKFSINKPLSTIISNLYDIMGEKRSMNNDNQRNILNNYRFDTFKQHYLGNLNYTGSVNPETRKNEGSFRQVLYNRNKSIQNIIENKIEEIIQTALTITATNGMNFPYPSYTHILIPPKKEFTLLEGKKIHVTPNPQVEGPNGLVITLPDGKFAITDDDDTTIEFIIEYGNNAQAPPLKKKSSIGKGSIPDINTSNTFFLLNEDESKTFLFPRNTVFKNQSNNVNKRISSQDPIYGFIENIDHEGDDIYLKDETITLKINESFKIESKGRVQIPVNDITVKYRNELNELTNTHSGNSNSEKLQTSLVAEVEEQTTPVLDFFGFKDKPISRFVKQGKHFIRSGGTTSSSKRSSSNVSSTVPTQNKPHPKDYFARLIEPDSGSDIKDFDGMRNILLPQNQSPDLTEFTVHKGDTVFELSPGYYLENNSNNTVHIPVKSVIYGTIIVSNKTNNNNNSNNNNNNISTTSSMNREVHKLLTTNNKNQLV